MLGRVNLGPLFIIRSQFSLLLLPFIFFALINSKNSKTLLLLAKTNKNTNRTLLYCFYFSYLVIDCLLLFIYSFISVLLYETFFFTNTLCSWGHNTKTLF